MPPEQRFLPRFAAEPPQEDLPYGRWGDQLRDAFLEACLSLDTEGADLEQLIKVAHAPRRFHLNVRG